jgi:two-component system cell cycle response regulator CpdR
MARVLLVEDEASLREVVAEALADCGHELAVAADGVEAMRQLGESIFDVVVSDISMPGGVSGIDLAEHMWATSIPGKVILVSGHARAQLPPIPEQAIFLPKPYRIHQLFELVGKP